MRKAKDKVLLIYKNKILKDATQNKENKNKNRGLKYTKHKIQ